MRRLCSVGLALLLVLVLAAPALAAGKDDDEVKVRRVEISIDTLTVRVNQHRTLFVEITPYNADDWTVIWETDNPDVATVDGDGVVTGISPGTATITATAHNGRYGTCLVTVPGTVMTEIETDTDNRGQPEAALDGGELLSAATLRLAVENAVKAGQSTLTYRDKSTVSAAALRGAAFSAEYAGGAISLRFQTVAGSSVTGQLTIDPAKAPGDERDIRLRVETDTEVVQRLASQARTAFGRNAAALNLAHSGEFGMSVQVAAKVDLSGMSTGNLALYTTNGSGSYTLLSDQNYWMDENGYLHFSTNRGGPVVVVEQA